MPAIVRQLALLACGCLVHQALAQVSVGTDKQQDEKVSLRPVFDRVWEGGFQTVVEITQVVRGDLVGPEPVTVKINAKTAQFERISEPATPGRAATVEITIEREAFAMDHPNLGNMEYDSNTGEANPRENTFKRMLQPWVGSSLNVKVLPEGKAERIRGLDDIRKRMERACAGDPLFDKFRARFTEDALRHGLFDHRFAFLPLEPVAPGDTWKREHAISDPFFGKLKLTYRCRLVSVEFDETRNTRVAVIRFHGNGRMQGGEAPVDAQLGMKPVVTRWTFEGDAHVELETGQLYEVVIDAQLDFQLKLPGGGVQLSAKRIARTVTTRLTTEALQALREARTKANQEP